MKRIILCFVVFLCTVAAAQEKIEVRRDTMFPVSVRKTFKTSSAKPGAPVEFKLENPVLIGNNIVVPSNALILGEVVEAGHNPESSPRSFIRIRIHTLRWKGHEAPLNAVVSSITPSHMITYGVNNVPHSPTFMEGIRVLSHMKHEACTDFLSDDKDVVVRSGVRFVLRQIDPALYEEKILNVGVESREPGLGDRTPRRPRP